jgi:hypothetical protein
LRLIAVIAALVVGCVNANASPVDRPSIGGVNQQAPTASPAGVTSLPTANAKSVSQRGPTAVLIGVGVLIVILLAFFALRGRRPGRT